MEGVVVSAEDAAQQRVLLDALPYIDREYEDPAVQAMVRSMIEAEMAAMEPRDYLAHLPPPPSLDRFADAARAASCATALSSFAPTSSAAGMPLSITRGTIITAAELLLHRGVQWC